MKNHRIQQKLPKMKIQYKLTGMNLASLEKEKMNEFWTVIL